LVAEVIAGELARALGLPVPEIVQVTLDPDLARTEPDPEIQDLIRASGGLNVALDYLPGSINFDPLVERPDALLASSIVWFDAFTSNVDRTARNTNLLMWHRKLHLIDHGAALYFHHDWPGATHAAASPFTHIGQHVLLPLASRLREADAALPARIADGDIERIVGLVPDAWLAGEPMFADPAAHRRAYVEHLHARLRQRDAFVGEALRAHGHL
jgi:hypothetical protein